MILTSKGLDLDFKETKKSLNIPVKANKKEPEYRYSEDPTFEKFGRVFEKLDFQQFLTRFKWNNLPEGMDSELLEKILYYHGSAMFFYIKELDKFYFLPYAMSGDKENIGIDFYGRFNKLMPYSFNGSTDSKGEKNAKGKPSRANIYLSTQIRENIKDIPLVENEEEAKRIFENGAVICWDTTPGIAYQTEGRATQREPFINYLITVLIQTKSALINGSGFNLFSSDTESYQTLMQMQLDAINKDREKGKLSAVVSKMFGDVQNLQSNTPNAMADFWSSLISVDNLRLKSMGIKNDGVIQKSQYQNIQEQSLDIDDAMQIYYNSFMERIKFSAIVNSIWGLNIYPEPLLIPSEAPAESGESGENEQDEKQAQEGTDES